MCVRFFAVQKSLHPGALDGNSLLSILNSYSHGYVAVPVIGACRRHGWLERLDLSAGNAGFLRVALHMFESLGWGREAAAKSAALPDEADALYGVPFAELFTRPESRALLGRTARALASCETTRLFDGAVMLPLLIALKQGSATLADLDDDVCALLRRNGLLERNAWTELGTQLIDRAYVMAIAGSYRPMLARMDELLFGDAASVFAEDPLTGESHVDRRLNVVASGMQHERYFRDAEERVLEIFNRMPVEAQPRALADMGCGDGSFLRQLYLAIRDRSERGKRLREHPLTLVGVDYNEAALIETRRTLEGLPFVTLAGDINDPQRLLRDLDAIGIDPKGVLHLRSFLDHNFRYAPPDDEAEEFSLTPGGVHVDADGAPVPPQQLLRAWAAHLRRWASAVNEHGLILLESHCLSPEMTQLHFDVAENFYFDALHGFSRQYLIDAESFLVVAASTGLFPRAQPKRYPKTLPFCRITLSHLEKRDYAVRQARLADVDALVRLETLCWPEELRASRAELQSRVERNPEGQFVVDCDGAVAAVIYSQRIESIDVLRDASVDRVADLHRAGGPVVQLLAVNVDPARQERNLGDQLLEFMLQRCSVMNGVTSVAGVTRCRDYGKQRDVAIEDYIRTRDAHGALADPILRFHELHGATVETLVGDYRPADVANEGCGVLIAYDLRNRERGGPRVARAAHASAGAFVEQAIRRILGNTREAAFAPDRPLMEMGLDSIDLLELHTQIQQQYALDLTPTFFFQANTAEKIRAFIEPRQQKVLVTPRNSEEPRGTRGTAVEGIAIIGIACRLPGGVDDLETLWTLLKEGKSAIGDLPPGRFSWPAGIEPDGAHRGIARGGFIADVDRFDAPFFRISPKEAECMDPQQRIVMELAWQALEDAGYAAQSLAGSPTSVYIGASGSDYARLLDQSGYDPTAHSGTGGSMAVLANRISYFFDFHGPSLQIDTACSSSLVAVHEAMQSLRAGESTMALVGGVHLIAHPANSIIYYKAGMLSKDGRCKTFDQSANGYVRAEGAAMLLLKPAAQAIEDGDRIHAILRGSATNHGGLASGLTVPHPERQAKLLTAAWHAAGVAPESLTYVEAHGTGTSLGDPIEVQGLREAFADRGRCGIGSIKTNVGHLEAAAGLAGLLKVVASLQHRQLPPTLHCDVVNPHIELGQSLEIVRELRPWTARDGVRRAGVSSFGSGGTNAHVVLEEFVAPAARSGTVLPSLFVLSAKNDERLRAYVERILSWLSSNATCAFDDLIFTYQTGRQAMDERLAIVVSSTDELRQKLAAHLAGEPVPDLFRENVTRLPVATKTLMSGEAAEALRRIALKNRDLRSLAVLWTSGVAIDWRSLYGELPHRITVPAYPFARERHWIARAHPLLDANLRTTFRRDDVFLRDHVVDGHVILPGVAHLEMARAAAGDPVAGFRDVFWGRPLLAGERSETACVRLTSNAFTIHRDGHPSFVFSQGTIERESTVRAAQFDLDEIRSRLPVRKSKAETFDHLTRLGFAYGPWFQRSEELHSGEREALVRMRMPRDEWPASAWHPALMDTALRASFLIGLDQNALNDHLRVPFSLGAARQFAPFPERCWAYARVAQLQKDGDPITDVSILDENGVEVFRFERFFAKRFQRATAVQAVHFYRPVWRADEGRRNTASVAVETAASLPEVVDRVRELLSRKTRPATRILAATSDAAIAGLAKAMPGIAPEVSIVTIDADDPAEGLRRERELDAPGGTEVRYRNGERLVRGLERIEKPHDGTSAFRRHGCYLITGAMGGLGFQTASYLAKHYAADLILIGRSAPDAAKLEALRAHAQSVEYLRADVAGIAALPDRRIDGVLHCAGVAGDVFTAGTTREDFERAMHAKVQGTLHLHELTKDQPLQFFVLFSSIASLLGDFSRGSYAAANRFLDAFAESRKGPGKTLSINWPYWQDGGFSKEFFRDEHNERAYFQQSGFTPLTTAAGMSVLESALRFEGSQVVVATGDREKIEHALGVPAPARVPRSSSAFLGSSEVLGREPAHRGTRGTPRNAEELSREVETYLIRQIAVATGLAESRIGVEESLSNYGIDSMIIMDLNRRLQADFASLPGTLFFEFNTVRDLARYFVENRADELRVVLGDVAAVEPMAPAQTLPVQAPALRSASAKSRDVAIIGMSGRYPMARNLDELWANLRDGRDCIETIPAERWDWRAYFQPEHPQPGQTNSKWGGFIEDVDKFDPLFFGISPREARYIDPQQRLFAEVVWEACEDACYRWDRNSNKAELPKENDVGVFIGSMYDDYQFLEKEISTSYWNSFIANRVSYFFNFRGPSITVDTACSSSLTAIQMAYENVRNGQCYAAVAGGTNLSIHPNKYSRLTQLNLLSSEGKCRSFGAGGNGYVPGEGVGAILLKRLEDAERDGDRIYAVIKGGALNHGGKTNGLTVPNPNAQAALVADALRDSGIDPRRISYIEAHGTGTSLGDPIEVAGLTKAFRQHTGDAQFCAIGSVKSNVGHLEGAAGVVAVQKVVLQMLHGQLVPSLHSETLNPIIDFAQSPFRVQRELAEWKGPRIAGISSFGAGGSNAHLILEEYVAPPRVASDVRGRFAVPLSARNADRLRAYAGRLLAFLERTEAAPADVESRLRGLLAQLLSVAEHEIDADAALSDYGVDDLQRLRILDVLRDACAVEVETSAFLQRNTLGEILSLIGARDFTIADVAHSLQIGREPMAERIELYASSIEELRDRLRQWLATGALSARPSFVDTPAHARKISLPTYPFARETYWVPDADVVPRSASVPRSSSA